MAVCARQRDQAAMKRACLLPLGRLANRLGCGVLLMLASACASHPVPPDWEQNAQAEIKRFTTDYLAGNTSKADSDFIRARRAVRDTGRVDLLAQIELVRCAVRVAVLEFDGCAGYNPLRDGATPAQQSYAAYLSGQWQAVDPNLLPEQHRAVVSAKPSVTATTNVSAQPSVLIGVPDPLSRLVAAGALLQAGRLQPADVELAIDAASAQGWRRPLLGWLGIANRLAEQRGDKASVERIARRVALIVGD